MNIKPSSQEKKSAKHRLFSLKNHPFVVPVVTFMTLFFISMVAFIIFGGGTTVGPSDSRVVNVYVDGEKQTLPTRAQTVGDLLERLSITVKPNDVVEPAVDSPILTDNFNINIYRSRPVVIVDGNKQVVTNTPDQSPRIAARNAGIVVYPEDEVFPEVPENLLEEGVIGERYVIERATPLTLILYGNISGVRTQSKTVGELLDEKGIETSKDDTIAPAKDTLLTAEMRITITRPGQKIATVEEAVPAPLEYVDDPNLDRGVEQEREAGAPGKKVVTYDIQVDEAGIEVSRTLLQEIVTVNPQRRLIARGTKIIISNPSENVQIGQSLAAARGWTGEQFYCLYQLFQKESGWSTTAANSSGAYGIPQALPGSKMASVGSDWRSNPATQITWGMDYIAGRYGTPCGAWSTSQARGWY